MYQNLYEAFNRHTVIFCASSFDFLRLKKHFKLNYSSVAFFSEDMDKSEIQKNRFKYESGQTKFILYSERAHISKKVYLRLAKNIVFYSLPEDPTIFQELVELTNPTTYREKLEKFGFELKDDVKSNSAIISLVTKYLENYQLEKVLGYWKVQEIIRDKTVNYIC